MDSNLGQKKAAAVALRGMSADFNMRLRRSTYDTFQSNSHRLTAVDMSEATSVMSKATLSRCIRAVCRVGHSETSR